MAFSLQNRVLCGLALLALAACNDDGTSPPVGRLNFPTAIAIDGEGENASLFIANSNFTLRYNQGSLHRYDLSQVNERLLAQCGGRPPAERDTCGIIPSEDPQSADLENTLDVSVESGILTSEVFIGSFASGISVGDTPTGRRLYVPVRSEANLTYVDVNDSGAMNCGGDGGFDGSLVANPTRHGCASANRSGDESAAAERDIALPADPVAVNAGPLSRLGGADGTGNYIITAHRGGRVSLFVDDSTDAGPFLVNVLEGLPTELVTVTLQPGTQQLWLPNALERQVARVGVALDSNVQDISRSYLYNAGGVVLSGVDTGSSTGDTRAMRFDPRSDVQRAYILSRRPRALISVDIVDGAQELEVRDIMEVGVGPSRLQVVDFEKEDGTSRTLAFVSCFDSRDVYVLDVDQARLAGIVRGLGGAFELATFSDGNNDFLYVLDFQSSIVRVLDLQPMFDCLDGGADFDTERECSPQALGFLGRPRTRRELI